MNRDPYTMHAIAMAWHEARLREAEHARLLRRLRGDEPGILRRACAMVLLASGAKLTRMGEHLRPAPNGELVAAHARRR